MTKTIGWTISGKRDEITFTHTSEMVDNISYCDGDNLNLGRKPQQMGEITLKAEGMKPVTVRYDSSIKAREFEEYYTSKRPALLGYYRIPGFQIALNKECAELVNAMIEEVIEAGKTDEFKAHEAAKNSQSHRTRNRMGQTHYYKSGEARQNLHGRRNQNQD